MENDAQPTVAFPHRRLPELHDAAGREACFTDVPTSKLPPIVCGHAESHGRHPDVTGRISAQDTNGSLRRLAPKLFSGDDRATDDALAKIAVYIAEYRGVCDLT